METTNIDTLLITSALFGAVIVAYVLLTGLLPIPSMEWFIIPQDGFENRGRKMKKDTLFITLSLIVAGIGSYVLLTGHWATPITEWFVMHQANISKTVEILLA